MLSKHFCDREAVSRRLTGRRIALVGSGPGSLENEPGHVDSHDVVLRVNNYKTGREQGFVTDVHYSFYGSSIRKTSAELKADGVELCMCKCPDAKFMESAWHERNGKPHGVDFRYIYRTRAAFWFCDTYIASLDEFLSAFHLLGGHVPTTGFSALLDVLSFSPASVYMTGFDFFQSGVHNVDEPWRAKNNDDPIGHAPERELQWLRENIDVLPVTVDRRLKGML